MSTIFSKIITGEIPATKVYEDENTLAFLDINPLQPGHTLIIPKQPSEDGLLCEEEQLANLIKIGQKIGLAQKKAFGCDGVNFLMNNGEAAGQEIFHTHLHVIPRFKGDGLFGESLRGVYEEGEIESVAKSLKQALPQ